MPTWSANSTSPFSALARIAGDVTSSQVRTASGFCSTARLSGRWNDSPSAAEILAHPGLGHPHPIQLRDQLTHLATRPQLTTKTQVTRQVIQNRLPHRRLLDPGQHLMLTHADARSAPHAHRPATSPTSRPPP